MQAIEIINQALAVCDRPIPTLSPHEVLVKVAAAGVNRPDLMQCKGLYPPPPGASDIPGLEIAGTVASIGEAVTLWQPGAKVCALVSAGGYAEYCPADQALCLPLPQGFCFIAAAALPETFFTVWSNVFDRGRLTAGETLLVHGGSGGIGTAAIQLAKAFGAKALVTVGTDRKSEFCLALGADAAINYRNQDFVEEIKCLTAGRGADIILDIIGGDYFPRNIDCLAADGRLLQIALQNGTKATINLLPVMLRRLTITGSTLRARDVTFKANIARALYEQVWPLLATGKIKPVIHSVFPLTAANAAHALMQSGHHMGKIILEVA